MLALENSFNTNRFFVCFSVSYKIMKPSQFGILVTYAQWKKYCLVPEPSVTYGYIAYLELFLGILILKTNTKNYLCRKAFAIIIKLLRKTIHRI